MSKWTWLFASLSEKPGVFGQFNQCLTFQSIIQNATPNSPDSIDSLPVPPISKALSSDHDVFTYLDDVQTNEPDICILAFTNPSPGDNGKLPLPISRKLFETIIQTFDTSPAFLSVFDTGLATYTSTLAVNKENQAWNSAQFIIQQNRAYSAFSMALTFSIQTGKTRALVFGAESGVLTTLFEYLGSMAPQPFGPMVIPAVAMELQAHSFNMTLKDCHDSIHSIEARTGMRQFNHSHEKRDIYPQDWKKLDLISTTRDLSSFLSRFAFLEMQAETSADLLQQMARTTESVIEKLEKDGRHTSDQYDVISKLENTRNWYLGLASRCRYLTKRTSAQTQTVYCLIAAQDNFINIDIARASRDIAIESHGENEVMRKLAELGRRDNELLIQMAKDSRNVAIMTARDGAAMQVIAAVTVLFLPATFIATLFSTTFFDFLDSSGPRVSPWTWIYVIVTTILTAIVQFVWAIMSKRKTERITQGLPVPTGCPEM